MTAGEGAVPPRLIEDHHTLDVTDSGLILEIDTPDAVNLTVPPDASVAFPVGSRVDIVQLGAGQVTVVEGSGVTVNTAETLLLAGRYAAASLYKRATDEWVLIGNLEAA